MSLADDYSRMYDGAQEDLRKAREERDMLYEV